MPGKLPIDRVREKEQAPKIIEREKQRYAEKQAKLDREQKPVPQKEDRQPQDQRHDQPHDDQEDDHA
jgi:hypothetical protein